MSSAPPCGPCGRTPAAGEPFDPARHCRACYVLARFPESLAARSYRGEAISPPAPTPAGGAVRGAADAWLAAGPCAHRGRPTGEVRECETCGGRVPVPLLECARHGRCHATAGKFLHGVTRCQECPDQAAELVPGLVDPLPSRWRQPGDWCDDPAEVARHAAAARHLATAATPDPPAMDGAGIITAGGGRYWPGIVVMVRMLRECGSTLPVQVWYRGRTEKVNPADVAGLGVTLIDADQVAAQLGGTRVPRGRANVGGWESKLDALMFRPPPGVPMFREAIFLDADAYPVSDPARLLPRVRDHGFAYWSEPTTDNVRWPKVGFPARPADAPPSVQGGQFGLDRRRMWQEIVLARWVCQHSDYYWPAGRPHALFGDQDAWRLAFQLTGFRGHVIGASEFKAGWGYVCWLDGVTCVEHPCFKKLVPANTAGEARAFRHYAAHLGAGDPPGWLTADEAALLSREARGKRVAEWGRFQGRSTAVLAAAAEHVWSVDRLPATPAAAEVARLGRGDAVTLIEGDYTEPATRPPWPPDLVFVDGEHDAASVRRDLAAAAELVGPGGAILLHDYGEPNAPDVRPTADGWAAGAGWEVAETAGTLAVLRARSR